MSPQQGLCPGRCCILHPPSCTLHLAFSTPGVRSRWRRGGLGSVSPQRRLAALLPRAHVWGVVAAPGRAQPPAGRSPPSRLRAGFWFPTAGGEDVSPARCGGRRGQRLRGSRAAPFPRPLPRFRAGRRPFEEKGTRLLERGNDPVLQPPKPSQRARGRERRGNRRGPGSVPRGRWHLGQRCPGTALAVPMATPPRPPAPNMAAALPSPPPCACSPAAGRGLVAGAPLAPLPPRARARTNRRRLLPGGGGGPERAGGRPANRRAAWPGRREERR